MRSYAGRKQVKRDTDDDIAAISVDNTDKRFMSSQMRRCLSERLPRTAMMYGPVESLRRMVRKARFTIPVLVNRSQKA